MADVFSKDKRSGIMRAVKSSGTKPEMFVRKYLFSLGFRYRKNYIRLPGKPDIALPKYKVAIFINGCFWHGHEGCEASTLPKSNIEYWTQKISRNKERDMRKLHELQKLGWQVYIIWECDLNQKVLDKLVKTIVKRHKN